MDTTRRVRRSGPIDWPTAVLAAAVVALATIGGSGRAPSGDAAPPPPGRFAHGAAGTARNGFGGVIAPSPTMASWPATGAGGNGGPFAFIGAQYGSLWSIPPGPNNAMGVGYCVMEDVGGEGTVSARPDPPVWDAGEMARAAALMATFGGDRVVPYGIDASGAYDVASGEWLQPTLFGGGEYTRRRQVAVNFGVKMFVDDVSPSGVAAGHKLARDTAVVNGSGGEFSALRNGYAMAQRMAAVAEVQHATGGIRLALVWATDDGRAPTLPGTYPLEVRATDSTGKPVGFVPIVQLSDVGIDGARSGGVTVTVDNGGDTADDAARRMAAEAAGWPTWDMDSRLVEDPRVAIGQNPMAADITDAAGVARFAVTIEGPDWEIGFHSQAPTADVTLHSGTGVQGQVTWVGPPQSATVHQQSVTTGRFIVRKTLDAADIQGERDMAGFGFTVLAGDGTDLGTFTTGPDGRTPPIDAPAGDHRITEVSRPAWAAGTSDGGPVTVRFEPRRGAGPETIETEVVYTNVVPVASITTSAIDAADDDRYLDLGGAATVVDSVRYAGLVPGTPYVVSGELMRHAPPHDATPPGSSAEREAPADAALAPPTPTGITGTTAFVPSAASGVVEVSFSIPPDRDDSAGTVLVAYETLSVGASGRVVAEHRDPNDPAQTVYVPSISSDLRRVDPPDPIGVEPYPDPAGGVDATFIASSAPSPSVGVVRQLADVGDTVTDEVHYSGLRAGERYRLDLTLHERHTDGTCSPTGDAAFVEFEASSPSGAADVAGVTIPRPGVFVAFEQLTPLDDHDPSGTGASAGGRPPIASHAECDDGRQTVWVPAISTAVERSVTTGPGTMTDSISVTGLADGPPEGATVSIVGSLHHHADDERTEWTCTDANRITTFELTEVDPNRPHRSPGEAHGVGWHSYDIRLVVEVDGSTWISAPHGCRLETESFVALSAETPVVSEPDVVETPAVAAAPPNNPPPTTTTPPPTAGTLPRTGGNGPLPIAAAAIALILLGTATLLLRHRDAFRDARGHGLGCVKKLGSNAAIGGDDQRGRAMRRIERRLDGQWRAPTRRL